MKHIKLFEEYKADSIESLNEEVKLFGKEIKFWPSYNDVLKSKLSFIKNADLDALKPGAHQREIKDLMIKIYKATKPDSKTLTNDIEESQVQAVQSMLKAMKELKVDLLSEDKIIGYISYFPEHKAFYYSPGFDFQK